MAHRYRGGKASPPPKRCFFDSASSFCLWPGNKSCALLQQKDGNLTRVDRILIWQHDEQNLHGLDRNEHVDEPCCNIDAPSKQRKSAGKGISSVLRIPVWHWNHVSGSFACLILAKPVAQIKTPMTLGIWLIHAVAVTSAIVDSPTGPAWNKLSFVLMIASIFSSQPFSVFLLKPYSRSHPSPSLNPSSSCGRPPNMLGQHRPPARRRAPPAGRRRLPYPAMIQWS